MKGDWVDSTLAPPIPDLYWNTRGRAVPIADKRRLFELRQQGFTRCLPETKDGAYNPVYDRGDLPSVEKSFAQVVFRPSEVMSNILDRAIEV